MIILYTTDFRNQANIVFLIHLHGFKNMEIFINAFLGNYLILIRYGFNPILPKDFTALGKSVQNTYYIISCIINCYYREHIHNA